MKLCWSAIVKNETAILERCVASLLPYIDGAVILDTGSSDGTPELLERLFDQAGKPLELHHSQFLNFAHARNLALAAARASTMQWDWLLLVDADMQLVVREPFKLNGGLSYDMCQRAGSLVYHNRRLVSREATGEFKGVTHEFLDIHSSGLVATAEFLDHADGSNRTDKLVRDVTLLEEALKTETQPGLIERYKFYLGQSFFDLGNFEQAAKYYKQRVELGGFEEERWYAQMQYAKCLGKLGDGPGFLSNMLRAYQMRPSRAEVLYELSKQFREQGSNHSSLLFSEAGLQLPYAKADSLFLNSWIYSDGLREEFAICAYYDERKRVRGFKECNKLALAGSEQARGNLYWYLQPLGVQVPSFKPEQIKFDDLPDGYVPCNPSVIANNDEPLILVRTVNYTINGEGGYDIRDGDGHCSNTNSIDTRNFLVFPDADSLEIFDNTDPEYMLVRGFEDSRLFNWDNHLYTISTVRQLNPEGWCEQVLASIDAACGCRYENIRKILPKERRHEKNWMPWVRDGDLRFVYRLGTLVDINGEIIEQHNPGLDVSTISGGSQVVEVDERTYLAVVHEARYIPGRSTRYYQHRFVNFLANGRVDRISAPFFFHDRQIEFAAGLAVFGKKLMVSYGVRDCEAWQASMDVDEVLRFVYKDAL